MMQHGVAIKDNSEQNHPISSNLMSFFRSWIFWALVLVTSYDLFEQICIVVERCQYLLSDVQPRRCFCLRFSNSVSIFVAARFMPKTSVKIAWHKPNDMPTSSATSLIVFQQLSKIIFFTASMFSSVVDVLDRPGRASSLTSSRPSLNRLYHKWICVVLIIYSPNVLAQLI